MNILQKLKTGTATAEEQKAYAEKLARTEVPERELPEDVVELQGQLEQAQNDLFSCQADLSRVNTENEEMKTRLQAAASALDEGAEAMQALTAERDALQLKLDQATSTDAVAATEDPDQDPTGEGDEDSKTDPA